MLLTATLAIMLLVTFCDIFNYCAWAQQADDAGYAAVKYQVDSFTWSLDGQNSSTLVRGQDDQDLSHFAIVQDAEANSASNPIAVVHMRPTSMYVVNAQSVTANSGNLFEQIFGGGDQVSHAQQGEQVILSVPRTKVTPLRRGAFPEFWDEPITVRLSHITGKQFALSLDVPVRAFRRNVDLDINAGQGNSSSSIRVAMLLEARKRLFQALADETSAGLEGCGANVERYGDAQQVYLEDIQPSSNQRQIVATQNGGPSLHPGQEVWLAVQYAGLPERGTCSLHCRVNRVGNDIVVLYVDPVGILQNPYKVLEDQPVRF